MNIYLDIETVPDQREGALDAAKARVKVPANYKNVDTIAKYIDEHAEEEHHRTALNGGYGEIFCVSLAAQDEEVVTVERFDPWDAEGSERSVLERLNKLVPTLLHNRRSYYIGHNIQFDLRFLFHRFVIHGVEPLFSLPYNEQPYRGAYYDTHYAWTGKTGDRSGKDGIKCKELAAILGIEQGANDIDGSEVWAAIQAGREDDVIAHCEADVRRVREVYKRLTFGE